MPIAHPTGAKQASPNMVLERDNFLRGDPSNPQAVICHQKKEDSQACGDFVNQASAYCEGAMKDKDGQTNYYGLFNKQTSECLIMHTDISLNANPFASCGWNDDIYHYYYSQDEQSPSGPHTPENLLKNNCMKPSSLKSTKPWEGSQVGIPGTYTLHSVRGQQPNYIACASSCWNPDNDANHYQYPVSLFKVKDLSEPLAKQQLEDFGLTDSDNCLCLLMTDGKNFKNKTGEYPQLIGERGDCFAASAKSDEMILSIVTEPTTPSEHQPFTSDVDPENFMSKACYIENRFNKGVLNADLCYQVPKAYEGDNFTFQDTNGIFLGRAMVRTICCGNVLEGFGRHMLFQWGSSLRTDG